MTKEQYKDIRSKKGFLHIYFEQESGSRVNETTFWQLLGIWLLTLGIHEQQGVQQIVKYLDQKHN